MQNKGLDAGYTRVNHVELTRLRKSDIPEDSRSRPDESLDLRLSEILGISE